MIKDRPGTAGTAQVLVVVSIVAVSVIAYLPAVDNSFISDDFTLLPFLDALETDPSYILTTPSEFFRVASYVFFWVCLKIFGPNPELYYSAGIALHAIVSLLVYGLVLRLTKHPHAAWAAAIFFAAYERHQEAVMWISAFNETILALNCLLFLIFWDRAVSRNGAARAPHYAIALFWFALALFSKEAAVVLAPLAALRMGFLGYSHRDIVRKSWPLFAMLGVYAALWLSQAQRNFFIADGHYALGMHFFPVYVRSLVRVASPIVLFLLPLAWLRYRRVQSERFGSFGSSSFWFFTALLVLSIVPYSFLTYLNHIPSRNTYFPSVGLAGLIGVLFAFIYDGLELKRMKNLCAVFLVAVVMGNIAYIWLKKEPQFRGRAAPTRELIALLNLTEIASGARNPVYVCGFPLHESIGRGAVSGFTRFSVDSVVFVNDCASAGRTDSLYWDQESETYVAGISAAFR